MEFALSDRDITRPYIALEKIVKLNVCAIIGRPSSTGAKIFKEGSMGFQSWFSYLIYTLLNVLLGGLLRGKGRGKGRGKRLGGSSRISVTAATAMAFLVKKRAAKGETKVDLAWHELSSTGG
jgi:hypothetical protein